MNARFPASARLHRPAEFQLALKGRYVARGAFFIVCIPRQRPEAASGARLGLVIGKRYAKKAVTRNTIKRVLRETFRHRRHDLPPTDYVFRLRAPVGSLSLTELKNLVRIEASSLLDRASSC